jgi:hypothetical protein
MRQYASARALATALTVLVVVQLVLTGLSLTSWITAPGADSEVRDFVVTAGLLFDAMHYLVFVAAVVVFLIWVHRAVANLAALGSTSWRFTPGGAVWAFLIPIVNLWQGHQVMATLWSESQPAPLDEESLRSKTTLVNWWWGGQLTMLFAGYLYPEDFVACELRSAAERMSFIDFVRLVTGVLFLCVLRATQRRQDEQWRDLQLRAAVPAPAANQLR